MNPIKLISAVGLVCALVACKPKKAVNDPVKDRPVRQTEAFKKGVSARNQRQAERLKWNREMRAGAYNNIGKRDERWDAAALEALEYQALLVTGNQPAFQENFKKLQEATKRAMEAGCNDQLMAYLNARYVVYESSAPPKEKAAALVAAAQGLEDSLYSHIIKTFACLRASNAVREAYDRKEMPKDWWKMLVTSANHMLDALEEPAIPLDEAFGLTNEIMEKVGRVKDRNEEFFGNFEQRFVARWPETPEWHVLRGNFLVEMAWMARGSGYADTVTAGGMRLFAKRLDESGTAYEKAWSLDPSFPMIAHGMMRVCLGADRPPTEMERWFKRGMEINPADYELCEKKLFHLEPKWHGSPEAMVKFGRECVSSTAWKGHVPLILPEAHRRVASYLEISSEPAYWKQATVWQDIKSAYERFFENNPDETGYRHNYAWYAFRCEQWEDFNAQIALVEAGYVNYSYFGGKEKYESMIAEAAAKAKAK